MIECLRDKALKFFSTRQLSLRSDYDLLCQKLNEKFGRKDLPHTLRRLLQDVRQDPNEQLEDFAERTQGLAVDGYPETPDRFVEIVAIDAFLKGCYDKRAALVAMDKNPESLEKALQYVRGAVANQKVIMGGRKSEIKRVTFDEPDNTENKPDRNFSVRVVGKEDYKRGVTDYERSLRKTGEALLRRYYLSSPKIKVNKGQGYQYLQQEKNHIALTEAVSSVGK